MDYGLIVTAIRVVVAGPQDRDSIPVQDLYNQVYDQVPRAAPATSSPADVGDVARELRGTLEACLGSQGLNWQDHLQATDLDDLANYWTHRIETQTTPPPDVHSSKPQDASRNAAQETDVEQEGAICKAPFAADVTGTRPKRASTDSGFGTNPSHHSSRRDDSYGGSY